MASETTCRSCDARVIFVPSAKTGKPMILDAEPRKGIVVTSVREPNDGGHNIKAVVRDVFTDHHATCPAAKDWTGKSRRDPPEGAA